MRKFGPGLPTRKRNRVIQVILLGKKDFYWRFLNSISGSSESNLWALIVDITRIRVNDLERLIADLPRFTSYCKERKIPSMITISIEQAGALDRKNWGTLIKGFEVKDLVMDYCREGILRYDVSELRELVSRVNDKITCGKRLNPHMNTYYLHNSFIMKIQVGENSLKAESNLSLIDELAKLKVDKFRLDNHIDSVNDKGLNRLICDYLVKSGKKYLDDPDKVKSNFRIRKESLEIAPEHERISRH
ncbi:MAG: hypothetical protein QGH39_03195 [Candidatus Thermoplasmatota archaeon]|jgi:hypothetical protein|nr:hypothetical protein [Candidatus Thermoplasmatota archaeon]MDP7264545.1 hypothetical protein [Candidatus Thermoplasmatota archaeon]